MSTLQQHHMTAIRATYPNELSLVILSIGARHNGALPYSYTAT